MIKSRCMTCNAKIVWLVTAAGRRMPVDAASVDEDDRVFNHEKHVSHFSTCPSASAHRRSRA